MLTDIKHAFFSNPLFALRIRHAPSRNKRIRQSPDSIGTALTVDVVEIGYPLGHEDPRIFALTTKLPATRCTWKPFRIANREVTCREYLEFISDDAYARPELWLSEGWEAQSARPGGRLCTGGVILAIRPAGACSH